MWAAGWIKTEFKGKTMLGIGFGDTPVKSDEDYQAEYDAETLAKAQIISGNPDRLERAHAAGHRLAQEKHVEAMALEGMAKQLYPSMVKQL